MGEETRVKVRNAVSSPVRTIFGDMRVLPVVLLVLICGGCSTEIDSSPMALAPGTVIGHPGSDGWRAVDPVDTAALLRQLELQEYLAIAPGASDTNGTGALEEDTVIVEYVAYACTCPDHEVLDSTKTDGIKAFYIKPASKEIKLDWRVRVGGNRFELIGTRSTEPYLPPKDEHPLTPGYLFTYRSIRVLRPFRVWGPEMRLNEPTFDAADSVQDWGASMHITVH